MNEPLAWMNGRLLPARQACVPVTDAGFMLGATVSEQLRTFAGRLFCLDEHLARLGRSLAIVGVAPEAGTAELATAAQQLVEHNHRLLDPADDLGLSLFVTPGPYSTMSAGHTDPLVGMHTYPLPFGLWADGYRQGVSLISSTIEQVSPRSWPADLKCRSRMHYYLATRQARQTDPRAIALLFDAAGCVSETPTANIVMARGAAEVVSPPLEKILPGISLKFALQQAESSGFQVAYRDLQAEDLATADELLLTSTPNCLLPVTRLDGSPVGDGLPGPRFGQLIERWSQAVGVDIAAQAARFSRR